MEGQVNLFILLAIMLLANINKSYAKHRDLQVYNSRNFKIATGLVYIIPIMFWLTIIVFVHSGGKYVNDIPRTFEMLFSLMLYPLLFLPYKQFYKNREIIWKSVIVWYLPAAITFILATIVAVDASLLIMGKGK